jgi:hypothetical protein
MTRVFHAADITPSGEVRAVEAYEYALLERIDGAVDLIALFSTWLWRSPEAFEVVLAGAQLRVRWRASSETSGVASLRLFEDGNVRGVGFGSDRAGGEVSSLAILLSGRDKQADDITNDALQGHLVRQLHDSGFEPGFGLRSLEQRPLVATLSLQPPSEPRDRGLFALWDRCFAASYFRKQGLV